ncbi:MAG: ATP-dependent protease, partial [Verrucomicrobia bacterium]|nr:ATP-dependent protease [Verrucomicrobiota bacterium]
MSRPVLSGPPSPEEFQRQLADFMRQQLHRTSPPPADAPADASTSESPAQPGKTDLFEFKY